MRLSNEYALVELFKDRDANGERLRIRSAKTGREVWLDPLLLEALTWTPTEQIAANLRTPFGPDDDDISAGPAREEDD